MKKQMKKWIALGLTAVFSLGVLSGCSVSAASYDPQKPVAEQVHKTIQGIDPGAGIMELSKKALEDYGLEGWELKSASDAAMMAELKKAYKNEQPIIITGWTPHWMFQAYDLKYLEDPKNSFGDAEAIHTLVRKGLEQDDPTAYAVLDRFKWSADDMEKVMNDARDSDVETAAKAWVESNPDKVKAWTEGLPKADGKTIKLSYVAWDSEIASSNVMKNVLESLGYQVELVQLDAGPMYASIAKGDTDAMVCAWLPTTHQAQYQTFDGKFVDLGPNLEGTKLGLVVPTYMTNVNSIEDLAK